MKKSNGIDAAGDFDTRTKQVIVVRKDLRMGKGKTASQVAHASLGVFTSLLERPGRFNDFLTKHYVRYWLEDSFTKIVVGCEDEVALLELLQDVKYLELPHCLITDNGTTTFNGVPTNTVLAIGPYWCEELDHLTQHLKLL